MKLQKLDLSRSSGFWIALGALILLFSGIESASAATAGYWRFDHDGKSAGQTATAVLDHTGTNDGTADQTPVYSSSVPVATVPATGQPNALALDFEFLDEDNVSVPHDASVSFGASAYTIEAWVKLETLGDSADRTTRAYVLQKKGSAGNDKKADYALMAQAADRVDQATAGVGKQSGFTGNELCYAWGDGGSNQYFVISNLEITDTDWHHISLAFDGSDTVRFTVDSSFETISGLASLEHATNSGELIIGARTNGFGSLEDPYDGLLDELRISSGVVPLGALLNVAPVPSIGPLGLGILALTLAGVGWAGQRMGRMGPHSPASE